jgi:hypothetical protein
MNVSSTNTGRERKAFNHSSHTLPGFVSVTLTMRRLTPRVQKTTPPVELNSPSSQRALIHGRANQGDQRISLFKW